MLLPAPFNIFIQRGIAYGPLVVVVYDDLPPLPTVDAPVVSTHGTPGLSAWTYNIVARNASGQFSGASSDGGTTTGNATLSGTNFNVITWKTVDGATLYDVYRRSVGTTPSTTGLIATTGEARLNDVGLPGDGSTMPTVGGPGVVIDLTGFTPHSQARRIAPDTILQDLQPAITDPVNGQITIPKFRDEETLDFSLCTNGKWSLVLENSTGDWLPPIIAGAYTVVDSVTRNQD